MRYTHNIYIISTIVMILLKLHLKYFMLGHKGQAVASSTKIKINKIQILQNKYLRIFLKASWLMRSRQV